MYAQVDVNSINKTATSRDGDIVETDKDFESWTCNMLIFDDETDKLYTDLVEINFYGG